MFSLLRDVSLMFGFDLVVGVDDWLITHLMMDDSILSSVNPLFCPTSTCSITCPFDTL